MSNLIESFLNYIRYELNLSARTVSSYSVDLRQFQEYLSPGNPEGLDPGSVTASDLRAWMGVLSRNGDSARTIRRKIQAVRAFYRYLMKRGIAHGNPAADLELAKVKKVLPAYMRREAMDELLDAPQDDDDYRAALAHAIVTTLYETGIRRSELIGLRDANVDTRRCEMKVHGKRDKDRIVPFGPELAHTIDQYRQQRNDITGLERPEWLFVRASGEQLYDSLVYRIVRQQLESVGGSSRYSPHVLRHTYASVMLNGGAELNSVKEILGHESLAATQVYTHITFNELKSNYKLAHPRALKKEVNYGSKD